jgi:hypothetical protein
VRRLARWQGNSNNTNREGSLKTALALYSREDAVSAVGDDIRKWFEALHVGSLGWDSGGEFERFYARCPLCAKGLSIFANTKYQRADLSCESGCNAQEIFKAVLPRTGW